MLSIKNGHDVPSNEFKMQLHKFMPRLTGAITITALRKKML